MSDEVAALQRDVDDLKQKMEVVLLMLATPPPEPPPQPVNNITAVPNLQL